MKKSTVEQSFDSQGVKPTKREKLGNFDLYLADSGFSQPPHFRFQRFGIDPGDFPRGMYCTAWFIGKDEKILIGRSMFFEPEEFNSHWRLNAARKDAARAVKKIGNH